MATIVARIHIFLNISSASSKRKQQELPHGKKKLREIVAGKHELSNYSLCSDAYHLFSSPKQDGVSVICYLLLAFSVHHLHVFELSTRAYLFLKKLQSILCGQSCLEDLRMERSLIFSPFFFPSEAQMVKQQGVISPQLGGKQTFI